MICTFESEAGDNFKEFSSFDDLFAQSLGIDLDNIVSISIEKQPIGPKEKESLDLSRLSSFKNLTSLYIHSSDVKTLKDISQCKKLIELEVTDCKLRSLKGVEELINLEIVNLAGNNLTSIEELSDCVKLKTLKINDNRVRSLESLRRCTLLESIDCKFNRVTNLSGLEDKGKLRDIKCGMNMIDTLEHLRDLTSLESLMICDNQLTDLIGIENCPNLRLLDVSVNRHLASIVSLRQCKELRGVNLMYTNIPTLRGLEEHRFIVYLYLPIHIKKIGDFLINYNNLRDFGCILHENLEISRDVYRFLRNKRLIDVDNIFERVYSDSQNVHNSTIVKSIKDSIMEIMKENVVEIDI
jgi:hypothetical protein